MGVHHGLAQLVGGRTGIPHGLANAVILAHAVRFNAEELHLGNIGWALGDADDAAGAVDRLRERIGLPARLSECGVTEEDVEAVVRMAAGNPNIANNPRPVSEDDVRAILGAACAEQLTGRTSNTRLKGVSAARRKRVKPLAAVSRPSARR